MASNAPYIYVVRLDVEPDKEELFNKLYDEEHIPLLLKVPGVQAVSRYETSVEGFPKYLAIYEVDAPDIPQGNAWITASDTGDWKDKIRPFTKNRSHAMYKRIAK